mgnify:CR=1 FL=1
MAFDYKHGGIIKEASDVSGPVRSRALDVSQPFDYLFPTLARDGDSLLPADDPASTIDRLKELGDAMADNDAPADDSTLAPVQTYLGQFIDHDITVTVFDETAGLQNITDDFSPVSPGAAITGVSNGRRAILDLDCLYGDGPTFPGESPGTEAQSIGMFDGPKMVVGMITVDDGSGSIPGEFIPPIGDLKRDLPRNANREPLIGDRRNDENTIVAQLHTGFLRFHNALVDAIDSGSIAPPALDTPPAKPTKGYYDDAPGGRPGGCGGSAKGDRALFEQASTLARRHYQWIVVNDFLKTIGKADVVERIVAEGPSFYRPSGPFPFMPFEHSVAAYRFGHSMVRHEYDFNRNFNPGFGQPDSSAVFRATFDQLFVFTGKGGFEGPGGPTPTLPFNWVIEWDRLVDTSVQSARKIDTRLASDLSNMTNEVRDSPESEMPLDVQALLKHLAQRNLLRSYLFSVPTGQAMATEMGFEPLSADEMRAGNDAALNNLLSGSGFLERTPAWYYILKEAEVREEGNSLGELGTAIVAETFIGLLKADGRSILNEAAGWKPADGADVGTIAELLSFAGVLDGGVTSPSGGRRAVPA